MQEAPSSAAVLVSGSSLAVHHLLSIFIAALVRFHVKRIIPESFPPLLSTFPELLLPLPPDFLLLELLLLLQELPAFIRREMGMTEGLIPILHLGIIAIIAIITNLPVLQSSTAAAAAQQSWMRVSQGER